MSVLVTCKFDEDRIKSEGAIVFPIISQLELSVAMATIVLIESVPKPDVAVPPPYMDATNETLVGTGQLALEIFLFESADGGTAISW